MCVCVYEIGSVCVNVRDLVGGVIYGGGFGGCSLNTVECERDPNSQGFSVREREREMVGCTRACDGESGARRWGFVH